MKLNPSYKHHLIIGFLLCVWSFLFALFSRPFEHGRMDLKVWLKVGIGYSLIAFLSYSLITFIQAYVFNKISKWNAWLEAGMYLLFYSFYTISTYAYYKSPIIRGIYDFQEYFLEIILNIIIILTPILLVARHYSLKLIPPSKEKEEDAEVIIRGTNKLDFLKIKKSELICVSNSQNYVEIFYLENQQLKTKLIRNSLKQIHSDLDFLVQIHRSHLINPVHFKSWKDANNILLNHMELPVSKTYKSNLLSL